MAGSATKSFTDQQIRNETRHFFQKVYAWMFAGLFVSGLAAYLTYMNPDFYKAVIQNKIVFWVLIGSELALIFILFALMKKLNAFLAIALFFLFSLASGLTLSVIFLVFTIKSIAVTFAIAAIMFGSMSLYGFLTKSDMTFMGHALAMGLWGLILAVVVNMFFKNPIADLIISIAGVIIFTGMTAYDTQRIKNTNIIGNEGTEEDLKESIVGALELYLDFVNMFLSLLRLTGKKN